MAHAMASSPVIVARPLAARRSAMARGVAVASVPGASRPVIVRRELLQVSAIALPTIAPSPAFLPAHLAPTNTFQAAVKMAQAKASYPWTKTLALGFTAGALIGVGAMLMATVGGSSPALAAANPGLSQFLKGAVGLPVGLTLVIMTGAELFTGNVFVMLSGLMCGKVTPGQVAKNWAISYGANLLGSLWFAGMVYYAAVSSTVAAGVVSMAMAKVAMPWSVTFVRAVICNWLVCLAVWNATAAQTTTGKILSLWLPISSFVAMGMEHSIANMFILPMGMLLGAQITAADAFFKNLVPVTLGNILGAAVLVAGVHFIAYGKDVQ